MESPNKLFEFMNSFDVRSTISPTFPPPVLQQSPRDQGKEVPQPDMIPQPSPEQEPLPSTSFGHPPAAPPQKKVHFATQYEPSASQSPTKYEPSPPQSQMQQSYQAQPLHCVPVYFYWMPTQQMYQQMCGQPNQYQQPMLDEQHQQQWYGPYMQQQSVYQPYGQPLYYQGQYNVPYISPNQAQHVPELEITDISNSIVGSPEQSTSAVVASPTSRKRHYSDTIVIPDSPTTSTEVSSSKKHKKTNPEPVCEPPTATSIFQNEVWYKVKKELGTNEVEEIVTEIQSRWDDMSYFERDKYEKMARAERMVSREFFACPQSPIRNEPQEPAKTKKPRKPRKPRKPTISKKRHQMRANNSDDESCFKDFE